MKITALGIQISGTLASVSVSMQGLLESDSDAIGIDTDEFFFAGLEPGRFLNAKAKWETRTVSSGNLYLSGAINIEPIINLKGGITIAIHCNSKVCGFWMDSVVDAAAAAAAAACHIQSPSCSLPCRQWWHGTLILLRPLSSSPPWMPCPLLPSLILCESPERGHRRAWCRCLPQCCAVTSLHSQTYCSPNVWYPCSTFNFPAVASSTLYMANTGRLPAASASLQSPLCQPVVALPR